MKNKEYSISLTRPSGAVNIKSGGNFMYYLYDFHPYLGYIVNQVDNTKLDFNELHPKSKLLVFDTRGFKTDDRHQTILVIANMELFLNTIKSKLELDAAWCVNRYIQLLLDGGCDDERCSILRISDMEKGEVHLKKENSNLFSWGRMCPNIDIKRVFNILLWTFFGLSILVFFCIHNG
ncbi:MAG: hypothetical protein PHW14_05030 [Candidatus Omnitrophica bacterium]|nr:hypothetical protein [Candidatus Omnitrophota bacterium]